MPQLHCELNQHFYKRFDIPEEEAVEKLLGVWRYNDFRGIHLSFEIRKKDRLENG